MPTSLQIPDSDPAAWDDPGESFDTGLAVADRGLIMVVARATRNAS